MRRQVVLDTETTGLSPEQGHRIIEIGCLEMLNRRLTGVTFHCYINPERAIDRAAEEVHGITTEFLSDKPVFSDISDAFLDFIKGAELIIHNAPFDVGFLNHEFKRIRKKHPPIESCCEVVDTLTIARRKHPGQKNNLDALCRRYNVDNTNRDLHGALLDSELLAQVYLLMTGGQETLFQAEQATEAVEKSIAVSHYSTVERKPLCVIKASSQELKAHQDFIAAHCESEVV